MLGDVHIVFQGYRYAEDRMFQNNNSRFDKSIYIYSDTVFKIGMDLDVLLIWRQFTELDIIVAYKVESLRFGLLFE